MYDEEDDVKKIMTGILAAALAMGLSSTLPAMASPMPSLQSIPAVSGERPMADVHEVQRRYYRGGREYHGGGREYNGGRHYRGGRGYWRGHRGYTHRRPGYRYHSGYWYPPAAFIAGAIIGGAVAAQPGPSAPSGSYHYGPAHVEWCMGRYRSYRSSDNTFQPYSGPRQSCRSPYM
ncbi:MAG: BA14K family protein [Mesorhizobium sp.]|nr:BA14K family protein [Mesorhizobium sp.]